jgi:RNA recognition motif. (a.k.a. RRM, RBD, or RNP domain)
VHVARDEQQCRGIGYVQYDHADAAQRLKDAVQAGMYTDSMRALMHHTSSEAAGEREFRQLEVCDYKSRAERVAELRKPCNLYVKNLPPSVNSKDALRKLFTQFGTITSVVCEKV